MHGHSTHSMDGDGDLDMDSHQSVHPHPQTQTWTSDYGVGFFQCRWADCVHSSTLIKDLVDHIGNDHIPAPGKRKGQEYACEWADCPRRGQAQSSRFALVAHMRSHTGEKPYECPHCPTRFTRGDAMAKHVRTAHRMDSAPPAHPVSPAPAAVRVPTLLHGANAEPAVAPLSQVQSHAQSQAHNHAQRQSQAHTQVHTQAQATPEAPAPSLAFEQYKVLKAKYRYLRRETHMLQDEHEIILRKMKRLNAEKGALLDGLAKTGHYGGGLAIPFPH